LSATLRAQLNNMRDEPRSVSPGTSTDALNQEILQVSSQLLDKSRQAQQEQERAREIADSPNQLPQQHTDAHHQLNKHETLQSALNALEERKGSLERIKQYQQVIDNYPKL
ncbi:hypothetical protein, partial [Escherichia coli]|uniref:hypothetical protein n=1 Tax=Escherichia coli TaxID=562 RepID=UPI00207B633F